MPRQTVTRPFSFSLSTQDAEDIRWYLEDYHFENAEMEGNMQPVKAAELGKLLHETGVPLLILNACRSASSEPPEQPGRPPTYTSRSASSDRLRTR